MKRINIIIVCGLLTIVSISGAFGCGCSHNVTAEALMKADAANQNIDLVCSAIDPLGCGAVDDLNP